jgi:hypothetical protein
MQELPQLKSFMTVAEAQKTQLEVKSLLLDLLEHPEQWNTLKVLHDEPEVWRMWLQLGNVRTYIHGIFTCEDPFLHFHPWRSSVELIKWSYNNRTTSFPGSVEDIIKAAQEWRIDELGKWLPYITTHLMPGSSYYMLDPRTMHAVQVTSDMSISLMNTDVPYRKGATKDLSRKMPAHNPTLTHREMEKLIIPTYDYLKADAELQKSQTLNALLHDINDDTE